MFGMGTGVAPPLWPMYPACDISFEHCCGSHRSQLDRASRRLQDHESVEGGDAVVATDIGRSERRGVARAAAGGLFGMRKHRRRQRDRGVCGGEGVVKVAMLDIRLD